MKKTLHYLLLILFFLFSTISQAQWQNGLWVDKEAYNWYFGTNAGLNFETSPPTPLSDGQIGPITYYGTGDFAGNEFTGDASSSAISDAQGNLLFYTNGYTVWNKNHEIMVNGTELICGSATLQSTLIVKAPGDSQKYYVFGIKPIDSFSHLYPDSYGLQDAYTTPLVVYSEVDMALDNGLGAVTENKNIIIAEFDDPAYSRISAVYHADGNNIWILIHGIGNNEFKAFLASETGVDLSPVVSSIGFKETGYPDTISQIKFSPDGTKIAKSLQTVINQKLEIFDFDNTTGQVTNILATFDEFDFIDDGEFWGVQGLEFSPNSQFLYVTGTMSGFLKQIDTEAGTEAEIKASTVDLYLPSGDSQVFNTYLQVAPDGKIYLAYGLLYPFSGFYPVVEHTTLNVINYPNNKGLDCGYEEDGLDLVTGKCGIGTPVFVQTYFASGILSFGNCANNVSFSTIRIPDIESIVWDFGDPASGSDNVSAEIEPVHVFSSEGTYTVTAIITSNGAQQTATTQITLLPAPEMATPSLANRTLCADGSGNATFDLTSFDAEILAGQNAADFTIVYYASPEDIEAGNPISMPQAFTTGGQAIYAVAADALTGCSVMIQFDLVVNPLPVAGTPGTPEECGNTLGTAVFDLTTEDATILNGQSAADFTVTYFTDAAGTNEILQPEAFESAGQTIYAKVTNTATGCSATTQFELAILPLPSFPGTTSFTGCSPFDLVAIAGEPDADAPYSYFVNEEDAFNNSNAIVNVNAYIVEGNAGSIYIRIQSNDGCVQVAALSLEAGNCFIPRGISPNGDAKNDSFDLSGFGVEEIKIFNRYGQQVYRRSTYTSEWYGQADNGDDLPTGTYYYMVRMGSGESRTGWVYLNRED